MANCTDILMWSSMMTAEQIASLQPALSALIPTLFLSVSVSNNLPRPKDSWIAVSAAAIAATMLTAHGLGLDIFRIDIKISESVAFAILHEQDGFAKQEPMTAERAGEILGAQRSLFHSKFAALHTSWLWLLLPIILTTAFVIFGAWRSAVKAREAEADTVDER